MVTLKFASGPVGIVKIQFCSVNTYIIESKVITMCSFKILRQNHDQFKRILLRPVILIVASQSRSSRTKEDRIKLQTRKIISISQVEPNFK